MTTATTTISTTKEKAEVGEKGVIYLDLAKAVEGDRSKQGGRGRKFI
jgi:hypothetical protein